MSTDLHHLAAAYALDALDPAERQAFEAHYPSCEICAPEVLEFRETAAVLAAAVESAPPPELRQQVLDQIGRTRQLSPLPPPDATTDLAARRSRRRPLLLGAVAAALFLVGGVLGLLIASGGGDDVDDVLAAPDAVVTALEGASGDMRVVWSPERQQVVVFGNDIAAPGTAQTYQLWFVLDDGVAPAGLFAPTDDGTIRTVLDVDALGGSGWGVTLEPEGGSPQPTGEILFSGSA